MRRSRLLLLFAVGFAGPGCAWLNKPYADDPLVRKRQTVIGNPANIVSQEPWVRPCPPDPPVEVSPPPKLKEGS